MMHILLVFTGSFMNLVSKCFETSLRVNICLYSDSELIVSKEKMVESQFKVVSELADQVFLLSISYELRVASKSVNS